jgi:hypothetical protein
MDFKQSFLFWLWICFYLGWFIEGGYFTTINCQL